MTYSFTTPLPSDHFVSEFIRYASQCVDGPHEYLETAALIALATATPGVRAQLRQYPRGLSTAFYALFIGDSTRHRKSTSAGLGLGIVDAAVPDAKIADQASPEALIEQLTGRDSALWYMDEIGETLDKLHHAKHMAGLRGLLLELYESRPYRYKRTTKRKGKEMVPDEMIVDQVHLTVLGCTTPALFEIVHTRDITSGFLARFAIVMPTDLPPRQALDETTADLTEQQSLLAQWLMKLYMWVRTSHPPVRWERPTLAIIDALAIEIENAGELEDENAKAMLQRLNAMTCKLAMLSAVGRPGTIGAPEILVTSADAEAAVAIAQRWRRGAIEAAARVGENLLEVTIAKVIKVLTALGGSATRTQVAEKLRLSADFLDLVERTMVDRGLLLVAEGKKKPTGPVPTLYTLMTP